MSSTLLFAVFSILIFVELGINASKQKDNDKLVDILSIKFFTQCEGKDATNYTLVQKRNRNLFCEMSSQKGSEEEGADHLIQQLPTGERSVNDLRAIAESFYPAGADSLKVTLWHCERGYLQGKFLLMKILHPDEFYFKKCSSILGYSYVAGKPTLLIADKLDLNVLIAPTGGFEQFKKGCTTICKGVGYYF